MTRKIRLIPPGEMLLKDWLEPLGLSQNKLARELKVPPQRVNSIVRGELRITPDMALRLGRYFNMTPQFWLNLQQRYDLEKARDEVWEEIERGVVPRPEEETVAA